MNIENCNGNNNNMSNIVYKLVLTGGPCSGKTTGQVRLSTFFENLGWKVYRVPETATTLFSGGIRFDELDQQQKDEFQENLIKTMISIENTFFGLGNSCKKNCLIVCDRGAMDAAAYMSKQAYDKVLKRNNWNTIELRDDRYNQVVHLVTAAKGAEEYYNIEDNPCRTEGLEHARKLDKMTANSWNGHPYIDVVDNSTNFETKMKRMIECVCRRIGIDTGDRLNFDSRKLKFLIESVPPNSLFPPYQDFEVVHDYLVTNSPKIQSRIRKRGQNGNFTYQITERRSDSGDQVVELRRQINHRDYLSYISQHDETHYSIYKIRRCFFWDHTYFQMDIYKTPCHSRCDGLILLEMYTSYKGDDIIKRLPPFLKVVREVTGDPAYSMFNLSLKEEWNSNNFQKNILSKAPDCQSFIFEKNGQS